MKILFDEMLPDDRQPVQTPLLLDAARKAGMKRRARVRLALIRGEAPLFHAL